MLKIILYSTLLTLMACSNQQKEANIETELKVESIENLVQPDYQVQLIIHDSITTKEKTEIIDKVKTTSARLFQEFNLNEEEVFKIHLWKDYEEFLDFQESLMGQRIEGSGGYVFGPTDLAIYYYNSGMVESVEHEFVHGASLHLNENFGNNPRWFWESVAIYESDEFIDPNELDYLVNGDFPSLEELNGMLSATGANKIYQVGYLLSEFIIENWSREKYLELIKESGNLKKVLAVSETEFMEQWQVFVEKKYLS